MRNLIMPEGVASISVFDQTFTADEFGTMRDIDDNVAREAMQHDPRIREFVPGGPQDPQKAATAGNRRAQVLAKVSAMDRTELFNAGRTMQVSLPATWKTEQMKTALLEHVASVDEDKLPIVMGGAKVEDGEVTSLSPGELASANRGNDSLGLKAGMHSAAGAAGGATFSQGSTPAPALTAAPAGLGQVQLTGTQQPPFNQLSTDTGVPTHDAGMASFPLSVPPIDPLTGQPYRAGDPNIPATSLPPARTTQAAVEQDPSRGGITEQPGAVSTSASNDDAHEHRVASAIEGVAGSLSDQATDVGTRPLFTPEQQAERGLAADAGQSQADRDAAAGGANPNHGNDAEGKGDKTLTTKS